METIITQIQNGQLPKHAIIENLKLQLYSKYAHEVILNRCSAKEAAARISDGSVSKEITSGIINAIRDDVNLMSPFRRIHPKLRKSSNPKVQEEIEKTNKFFADVNDKKIKVTNAKLARKIVSGGLEYTMGEPKDYVKDAMENN